MANSFVLFPLMTSLHSEHTSESIILQRPFREFLRNFTVQLVQEPARTAPSSSFFVGSTQCGWSEVAGLDCEVLCLWP